MMVRRVTLVIALLVIAGTIAACCFGQGNWNISPPIELAPGFSPDPQVISGTAGGPTDATAFNPSCTGHVSLMPSHIINVAAPMRLRILAHSDQDITLVLRLANNTYVCNDDTEGTDPAVEYDLPQGAHMVWVGTYSAQGTANYTLAFTTNPVLSPSTLSGGAPGAIGQVGGTSPQPAVGGTVPGTVLTTGTATVAVVTGNLPGVAQGSTCNYAQTMADPARNLCHWRVECSGVVVYGEGSGGFAACNDPAWPPGTLVADLNTQTGDNDPSLIINAGGLSVRDDAAGPRGEFSLTATLNPAAATH